MLKTPRTNYNATPSLRSPRMSPLPISPEKIQLKSQLYDLNIQSENQEIPSSPHLPISPRFIYENLSKTSYPLRIQKTSPKHGKYQVKDSRNFHVSNVKFEYPMHEYNTMHISSMGTHYKQTNFPFNIRSRIMSRDNNKRIIVTPSISQRRLSDPNSLNLKMHAFPKYLHVETSCTPVKYSRRHKSKTQKKVFKPITKILSFDQFQ